MTVLIKRITVKDLGKFFDFFERTVAAEFPEYSKKELDFILNKYWSKKAYRNWLKNNRRFILAAWDKNKIIAVLDAEQPFLGVSFCSWLMVDRKFQGKGIGTRLLQQLEKTAVKKGAHMIYLYTSKHNVSYYKKIGYELGGIIKKSWFGQDNYIFSKLLRQPKESNYLKRIRL